MRFLCEFYAFLCDLYAVTSGLRAIPAPAILFSCAERRATPKKSDLFELRRRSFLDLVMCSDTRRLNNRFYLNLGVAVNLDCSMRSDTRRLNKRICLNLGVTVPWI